MPPGMADKLGDDISKVHISETQESSYIPRPLPAENEAPILRVQGVDFRDITKEFSAASDELGTGQLVKDDFFTLFESVAALEIMDPKMDSGYQAPGETLEDDYDVLRHLSAEEVVGIIDQLLSHEEEDFVTQSYNRDLLSRILSTRILAELDEALNWLTQNPMHLTSTLVSALQVRLVFRKAFLVALSRDVQLAGDGDVSAWQECIMLIPKITDTEKHGRPVPESFSSKIQRKLASTVPPRPIVQVSFEKATAHLRRTCVNGKDLALVLDYKGSGDLLNLFWTLQSRKPQPSMYIRSLLQSLLCIDMKILGRFSIRQFLIDDMADLVLPASPLHNQGYSEVEVPTDPRYQISKRLDAFVSRAGQPYIDLFRAVCQNRSRIRRIFCHTIHDWDSLQLDAEDLDVELRELTGEKPIFDTVIGPEPFYTFPLSSWAYYHKLCQMEWIIQLGFELAIYQADELGGMYWYLNHLIQTRIAHLERIRYILLHERRAIQAPSRDIQDSFAKTFSILNFSLLEAQTTRCFAEALSCLYALLARLSLMPIPSRPYSTDALRYDLRMKPFFTIGLPPLVPFAEFKEHSSHRNTPTPVLLQKAQDAITQARHNFEALHKKDAVSARATLCKSEWKQRLTDGMRACISASIALAAISKLPEVKSSNRAGRSGGSTPAHAAAASPARDTSEVKVAVPESGEYHDWWIVPTVFNNNIMRKST
ncbi:MAG: hypothetical protein M1825_001877 [Sarcosagium campestre]|nr:MAG: hypothetical protein M1825_001877 [Sarcosagium campestre]